MLTKMSTVYVILTILISSQFIWGAARISGEVTDAATGEALFGANLILEGTSIGSATNAEGKYLIQDIPAGSYSLKISYIGYEPKTIQITLKDNEHLEENIKLEAVAVATGEVVVTAQASGQNAAINQQLASSNIVNVVSSARIQELPDANAAESIGRLPGISLVRSGGQATEVVIRGISPQYNQITIAGVPVPANESGRQVDSRDALGTNVGGGRGVDMRMISSSSLAGIEVYKTNTPDMDGAVLGGTVNLGIRKASKGISERPLGLAFLPGISFEAQGGYTNLTSEYNNYKFDLSLERRFLDEHFGVFVQGVVQQQNFTADNLDANYTQIAKTINPDSLALTDLNLYFTPRVEKRYNATATFDYDLPNGSLALLNIFSQSKSTTNWWRQQYGLQRGGNNIHYYVDNNPTELNLVSNILSYSQKTSLVNIDATLSHSYSENIAPNYWELQFEQLSVGTDKIDEKLQPVFIAQQAYNLVNLNGMNLRRVNTSSNFTRERVLRGAADLSRDFNFADFLSLELKAGGMYAHTTRNHNHDEGNGSIFFGELGTNIVNAYPWLGTDWGIGGNALANIFITPFMEPLNIGTYLNGDFAFNNKAGLDYMTNIKRIIVDYGYSLGHAPTGGAGAWVPNMFGNIASDYSGYEDRSAGYLMGTFHFGQLVSVMVGARYQNLTTSYQANRVYVASVTNPYPQQIPHIDTTVTKTHGYWLPDVNVKFNPLPWLSLRAAYTNTLAYPDFRDILPIIDVYSGTASVTWNNVDLKPARSENYDLQLSVYNNAVGLFTFGGFLKHIRDFVFFQGDVHITDPTRYPGLSHVPQYPDLNLKAYSLDTYYNNPNMVELWGIESDWQTHFWYLPGVLSGLVLNVNYTHVFSKAEYPLTVVGNTGYPLFQPTYTDTTYEDKLINQPDNIVNVSLGWDYQGFSILGSLIYQSAIFNSTNFWNALRTDKKAYTRIDLAAKQKLPWYGIEVFMNVNNLNGANDTYIVRGNGFNDTNESYGLTAQLGFRVNVN